MDNKNLMFLVLVILILGFFSTGLNRYTGSVVTPEVTLEDDHCEWKFDHFEACVTISWNGLTGDYAKAEITGGESIEDSPEQFQSPFTYCQDVGTYEGKRAANVFLYEYRGKIKKRIQSIKPDIECKKEMGRGEVFEDHISFTAQRTTGRADGSGEFTVSLPKKPVSCEFNGQYEMVRFGLSHAFNKGNLNCFGKGKFYGIADKYTQKGSDDADPFYWGGEHYGYIDPPQRNYEGSIINIYTCDRTYMTDPRYYVKAKVIDFSKDLKINWEYHDDGEKPTVRINMDMKCELEKEITRREPTRKIEQVPEVVEIPAEEAEPFLEEEPAVVAPVKKSFLRRLKEAFNILFGS